MSGPDIQVSTETVDDVAKAIAKVGEQVHHGAGTMRALELHSSHRRGDPFGLVITESTTMGRQANDLINMLAAYGDLLGDMLQHAATQMHTMSGNYVRTDESMAGK